MATHTLLLGDARTALASLPDGSISCCVTSPPYYNLRSSGLAGEIGQESHPQEYVDNIVRVFREVRRCLSDDGSLWLNIGDSYAGSGRGANPHNGLGRDQGRHQGFNGKRVMPDGYKAKDLYGIPWMVAFALRGDGWYLRRDILWHKPVCKPESVRDRPTCNHEYIFFLTKSYDYRYDASEMREMGANGEWRNRRTVWTVATRPQGQRSDHYAAFPPELIAPCIRATCAVGGTVLDPFCGTGTTGAVALGEGRNFVGVELVPTHHATADRRLRNVSAQQVMFF